MEDMVTVRIWRDGRWIADQFLNLKDKDRFQIINPDGTYHYDQSKRTNWTAVGEPYLNDDGIWQIDTAE